MKAFEKVLVSTIPSGNDGVPHDAGARARARAEDRVMARDRVRHGFVARATTGLHNGVWLRTGLSNFSSRSLAGAHRWVYNILIACRWAAGVGVGVEVRVER